MAEACGVIQLEDGSQTEKLLQKYMDCADYLIQKCRSLEHITGISKLQRKCQAELKYLKSLSRRRGGFDSSHLRSSNLSHYLGVVHAAQALPEVIQVLQAFQCPGRSEALHVDVVAGQGHLWVKVVARKAQALHLVWAGRGQYGEKDLELQAKDFLLSSQEHPINFQTPDLIFAFYNGVTEPMADHLKRLGVTIVGNEVEVSRDVSEKLVKVHVDMDQSSDDEDDEESEESEEEDSSEDVDASSMAFVNNEQTNAMGDAEKLSLSTNASTDTGKSSLFKSDTKDTTEDNQFTDDIKRVHSPIREHADIPHAPNICKSSEHQTSSQSQIQTGVQSHVDQSVSSSSQSALDGEPVCDMNLKRLQISDDDTTEAAPCDNSNEQNSACQPASGADAFDKDASVALSGTTREFVFTDLLVSPIPDYRRLIHAFELRPRSSVHAIDKVNLDVTALITVVSNVANGSCHFHFKENVLSTQAEEERTTPVKPELDAFIEGKQLFACETAVTSFQSILDLLGGDSERVRAAALLERITVVPDCPSFRTTTLLNTGKIKDRSKIVLGTGNSLKAATATATSCNSIVFGTGDSLKAVTVTANSGFVRAAEHQGVMYSVFIHSSRALTEQKEPYAQRLDT